jgi:DNA polymerase I-like protein with 3'-5' exonuclease and polymerase domains
MGYVTTESELVEAMSYLKTQSIVAVDTETNGLDPVLNKVLLLQVGTEHKQFVFDVFKLNTKIFTVLHWLTEKDLVKVLHNAKFDYKMIKGNFEIELTNMRCTMLANQLLTTGKKLSSGLDSVLYKYLGVEVSKAEQKSFIDMRLGSTFTESQIKYAGDDTKHLIPLYKNMQRLLESRNMDELSRLEYRTVAPTGDMELNGLFLDRKKWTALKVEAEADADIAKKGLDKYFEPYCGQLTLFEDVDINYRSPKQLLPILSKITGMNITSTGEQELKKVNHEVVDFLLDYREKQKRISTYGEEFFRKFVSSYDGRIHSNFKQLGADSGRYSSTQPNLQNIPSDERYRSAFTAQDSEYRIIASDYARQDLRGLADISKEPGLINAINNKVDLHTNSASLIYGIPYKDITKKQRNAAKALTFGLIYGIGPGRLAENLGISFMEAKTLMNKYFSTFPNIKKVLDQAVSAAKKLKYALSPLDKRRRDLSSFDWDDKRQVSHALNISKNIICQGASASITKLALCLVKEAIDSGEYDAKIVNVVHDEILVEAHEDDADDVGKLLEVGMIEAFEHYCPGIAMEVEAVIDNHWVH